MKLKKMLLLVIVGLFCFMPVVKADNDVIIKSINPISSTEGVSVNSHSKIDVGFNDLNQTVMYRVVLENNTNKNLYVNNLEVLGLSQEFVKFTLDDSSRSKVIKPNKEGKVTLIVSTAPGTEAGRNLSDAIKLKFLLNGSIENPPTNSNLISTILLVIVSAILITIITVKFNNRKSTVLTIIVCFFLLGTSFVFADDTIVVEMVGTGMVTYTSQNNLETSGRTLTNGNNVITTNAKDIWVSEYYNKVKNITISNQTNKIDTYKESFDLTINDKQRIIAYIIENGDTAVPYDLYIMANGVIYAPEDATALFSFQNVETIKGFENILFDNTTKMTGMFSGNEKLTSINITSLNTANVTDTSYMFYRNYKLELDESKFNLEKVQNKTQMFSETNLYKMIEKSVNGKTVRKYTGEGSTEYENDVYYYYGNVSDNNVKFANICWKMIRTTETGGTKLVYNSIPSASGQCDGTSNIGRTKYNNNNNSIDDGSYVYPNGSDSVIKEYIDTWYEQNMTEYTTKLEDTVWCNDRTFGIRNRESSPSLVCPQVEDSLTVASGKLKYPVAVLTMDERILTQYPRSFSWTMTPVAMVGNEVVVGNGSKFEINLFISYTDEVLPSISLKQSTRIISGDGTVSSPYVIE